MSCAANPAMSTGSDTSVAAAHSRARNRPSFVMNPTRKTGAVLARVAVRFTANMNSFQLKMKQISAVAAMPGIAATALICFIFSWNELLFARVLTATVAETAPVFLTSFVTSQGLFLAKVCAAAVVVSLPVLIAGFAAQDKLVQGLSLGAIK